MAEAAAISRREPMPNPAAAAVIRHPPRVSAGRAAARSHSAKAGVVSDQVGAVALTCDGMNLKEPPVCNCVW